MSNKRDGKLKIRLDLYGKTISMEILDQCDTLRWNGQGRYKLFKSSNGILIKSAHRHNLDYDGISIWGHDPRFEVMTSYLEFDTEDEAKLYYDRLVFALNEWRDNGYFKTVGSLDMNYVKDFEF